ncbi:MAG: hypothetical protein RLY44_47 [Actinomycetota bacterium]|jgi:hypothetical protein
MHQPPNLSREERRAALYKAAEHRKLRARFKEEVREGKRDWRDALESTDIAIRKMRVKELIESLPGFGSLRAIAILDRAGISHSRRVQGLGVSQREKLQRELKGR